MGLSGCLQKPGNRENAAHYEEWIIVISAQWVRDVGLAFTDNCFIGSFIIPMERFCQLERLLVWLELDRETSKRQVLTIPIQALTGRETLFQPLALSGPVAEYPCCGEDAFISQSWMPLNVHFPWPMPWS